MTKEYNGPYLYNKETVNGLDSNAIGVYYCGYVNNDNSLIPHYIGKGTGDDGIRGRLLDHLREDNWPDVTHFGYCVCSTITEAENLEADEIKRLKPKYNDQGK